MIRIAPLFRLTPAEASIAAALLDGLTVDDISASRGLSPKTVRTHVKSLLAKTGTSRQADVIRLFARFAAPRRQ